MNGDLAGERRIIVAVDGLSSCGKSSFALRIAQELDYIYIDTGAMYRAMTYALRQAGIKSPEQLANFDLEKFAQRQRIMFAMQPCNGETVLLLNGWALRDELRSPAVSEMVSHVAALPKVREKLVAEQRAMGASGGVCMDGRDIGSVVFPNAEIKIFMKASPEVRAQRRWAELQSKGMETDYEAVLRNLNERDYIDQHRSHSPMQATEDAIVLDNSTMTIEEQMAFIRPYLERAIGRKA